MAEGAASASPPNSGGLAERLAREAVVKVVGRVWVKHQSGEVLIEACAAAIRQALDEAARAVRALAASRELDGSWHGIAATDSWNEAVEQSAIAIESLK